MNKLNMLHLFGATLFLALLLLYLSASTQSRIADARQENAQTAALGEKIRTLKSAWDNSSRMRQRIDSILNQSAFKPYVASKKATAREYKVQINAMPPTAFDRLVGKLFNAPIAVGKMSVTRNGEHNVSLALEFLL